MFKKFNINGTPTVMFLDSDGAEVDWLVGYGPPPEKFQERVAKILAGGETFKALNAAYAKNPKDAATVFKLADKWAWRAGSKSTDLYKEVVALDPEGKAGNYTDEYSKITVPYTEYAALQVAGASISGAKPDPKPIRDFMVKYPNSPLLKDAYGRMAYYYGYRAPKEDAASFFEEYAGKFPDDPAILDRWLARILRDKGPYDKGAEVAEKARKMRRGLTVPDPNQNAAEIYWLKGEKDKAEDAYGKGYIENQVFALAYNLINWANYWLGKDANKDGALAMAEKALAMADNAYVVEQVAGIYLKLNKDDKALALFGPAYAEKNGGDAGALTSYASFWSGQGKNLDSALAAAKKAVEMKPSQYYSWFTLSVVQSKMKNTAEAVRAMEKAIDLAPEMFKDNYRKMLEKLKAGQGQK